MCRFLAYRGEPILVETLVCTPCYSLIHQSMHDENRPNGQEVPQGHCLIAAGDAVRVVPMAMELAQAA